ncbi:MAG: hypothetical protein RR543_03750 [Erysipelotrichales bacterium]
MKKKVFVLLFVSFLMFGCKDKDVDDHIDEPNTNENTGQMVKSMPIKLDYFKNCKGEIAIITDDDSKEKEYECKIDGVKAKLKTSKDSKYIFSLEMETKSENRGALIRHLNEILGSSNLVQIDDVDIENLKENSFIKINDLYYKKELDDNKIELEIKNLG